MQQVQKYKKTELGEIPEDWKIVKIQDICKTSSGGTPSRSNPEYYKGNIPWVKTGELKDRYIFKTDESISEDALRLSSAKLFPPDTVLFAMYGATIGKTAITKISATTNQACCAFIPLKKESIHPYFLQQYFILVRPKIISKGEGAGQPNTSQDFLKTFRIVYPPFKEQQKIASILSNVDELIQKTDQIIEQTQRLKKGLMERLLTKGIGHTKFKKTELGEIPQEWFITNIDHLVKDKNDIKTGPFGSSLKKEIFVEKGYKIYGQENVIPDDFSIGDYFIPESIFLKMKQYEVKSGDILVSLVGTRGKVSIVPKNINPGIINPRLLKIRVDESKVLPEYMKIVLESDNVKKQIKKLTHGLTMEILNTKTIKQLLFCIPTLSEQKKFVSIIYLLNYQLTNWNKNMQENVLLKKGLMQQLLTGKIRVKV